jgi:apolipoprotein D and lipocalin family protein
VDKVELGKFMGQWFVHSGRFTFLEEGAHNAIEKYVWNEKEKRIDISFTFNKDSFDGKVKSIPQKGWVYNTKTNAHWKVRPFWPLKLDYLIIGLAEDYSWTAVGVPSGKYLWIMTREKTISDEVYQSIISELKNNGYPTNDIVKIPHAQ